METFGHGTQIAGRYQLVDLATSEVAGVESWSATDRVLERNVRVHLLREGRPAPALDSARRAALIKDERLIRVIDAGEFESVPYVITAVPNGDSLFDLVKSHEFLPPDQARALIGEAAEAIEAARRRGVYHLVLRPTTIYRTPAGKVLLTGLGLEGALLGLDTAPPLVTARADAMGLVANLYYALTGLWPNTLPPGVEVAGLEQAPVVAGSPVPPAELGSGVPNDLDTLCSVTFGPNNDGPHSASELARELAPWPDISAVDPLIMADEERPVDVAPPIPAPAPAPPVPQRSSIKKRVEAGPVTPPVERKSTGVRATPPPRFTGASNRPTPSVFPGPAVPPPSAQQPILPTTSQAAPKKKQKPAFNPTPWVLGLVSLTVIFAVVLAIKTVLAPPTPRDPSPGNPLVTAEPVEPDTPSPEPTGEPEPDPDPEPEPSVPAKPIYIDIAEALDPDGDGQHPELQHLAIDGNSETFWTSQWFLDPSIPGRAGIGLGITLEETSKVSEVTLEIDGEGGHIEIRNTSNSDPGGGDLLAEGPADGTTVFEFDEVELDSFVIWTTELPEASDGNNRIAIADVRVK